MKRAAFILLLILLSLFAFTVRCWNLRDVFVEGGVFFVDPDCYSRMTRARMVAEGEALTIRHHDFENYPTGTRPHTTAPLDWMIAAGRWVTAGVLRLAGGSTILGHQTLDVSGALVPPVLGALACGMTVVLLKRAGRHESQSGVWAGGILFAISPILVHGTLLGRPDHQALLIPLLAVALLAELILTRGFGRRWGLVAGLTWGFACWVSLYEPLILLFVVAAFWLVADRGRFASPGCRAGWIGFGTVLAFSFIIDGWRLALPDPATRELFARWSVQIGELQPATPSLMLAWTGWLGVLVPVLLLINRSRASMLLLTVFLVTLGLTIWQVRWGYFLALAFVLALPWIFSALRRAWIAWPAFIIALWPVARTWDAQLYPDDEGQRRLAMERAERVALRKIAETQRERAAGPFIAPWWHSPALAYWSRQPGIAGSSHESLPGIADTARVYLAPDEASALPILRKRGVKWILSDAPDRIIPISAAILGVPAPPKCLARDFARHIDSVPETSSIIPEGGIKQPIGNQFFQVWWVREEAEPAGHSNP